MYPKQERQLEKWLKRNHRDAYNYWRQSVLDGEQLSSVLQREYPRIWKEWMTK